MSQPQAALSRTVSFDEGDLEPQHQPAKKASLTIISSAADLGVHVFIDGPVVLGRNPHCNFPVHDHGVSWQHAKITPLGDEHVIEDQQSTNGTRVNGARLANQHVLQDGEKIFVGQTVIRYSLADDMDVNFQSEVAMLVGTDPLTGLRSKRRFDEALEYALRAAKDSQGSLGVLMLDMDGVKQINDTHGHLFGAHVIGETGRLIDRVLGSQGYACRFGGDEFSVCLPSHDLSSACAIGERIRQAVETAGFEKDGIALNPTISVGVACYPQAGQVSLDLIAMADKALYRAKALGKNNVAT